MRYSAVAGSASPHTLCRRQHRIGSMVRTQRRVAFLLALIMLGAQGLEARELEGVKKKKWLSGGRGPGGERTGAERARSTHPSPSLACRQGADIGDGLHRRRRGKARGAACGAGSGAGGGLACGAPRAPRGAVGGGWAAPGAWPAQQSLAGRAGAAGGGTLREASGCTTRPRPQAGMAPHHMVAKPHVTPPPRAARLPPLPPSPQNPARQAQEPAAEVAGEGEGPRLAGEAAHGHGPVSGGQLVEQKKLGGGG